MFHRPKSEDQGQQAPTTPAQQPAPQPVAAAPVQPPRPAATQPISTPVSNIEEKRMNTEPKMPGQSGAPGRPLDIPGQPAGFQPTPPGAGLPPRAQFGYQTPAAAPVPATPSTVAQEARSNVNQGRRLVIGQGITLAGEIEACDYLVIEGTVEAALKGASVLDITQTGMFYGTVEIDEATVAGRFEGEITVNGRLTITATGSVTGTVSYKELSVESGGILDGKISPLSGSKAQKKESKPSKKGFRNDNEGDEGSLPFGNKAAAAE